MTTSMPKKLHWLKQVQVPAPPASSAPRLVGPTARDRLVAALADRPRTVAQLAQAFGLAQPTVLEQVRRALADGLIVEVRLPEEEKRYAAERYYAPAVPVIRQTDRDLLESACCGLAEEIAATVARNWGDVQAVFAMTHLAREGWEFDDLWPFLHEMISRVVDERLLAPARPGPVRAHGLAWVEEIGEIDTTLAPNKVEVA